MASGDARTARARALLVDTGSGESLSVKCPSCQSNKTWKDGLRTAKQMQKTTWFGNYFEPLEYLIKKLWRFLE